MEITDDLIDDLCHKYGEYDRKNDCYGFNRDGAWSVRSVVREILAARDKDAPNEFKQPHWGHVQQAFLDGARECHTNHGADEQDFKRAADGYTKRVFEEVDPESERRLRMNDWGLA